MEKGVQGHRSEEMLEQELYGFTIVEYCVSYNIWVYFKLKYQACFLFTWIGLDWIDGIKDTKDWFGLGTPLFICKH